MSQLPRKVAKGERPSATHMNALLDYIKQLRYDLDKAQSQINNQATKDIPVIRPVQLSENIGPEASADFSGRDGEYLYWNGTAFVASGLTLGNIASLDGMPMDSGDRVACVYHKGINYPLWNRTVRHAITWRTDAAAYPTSATNPDVYPIKFVKLTYTETAGAQGHVQTFLQPSDSGPDDFVHNIFSGPSNYIPEGSLIVVYAVIGLDNREQWFTYQASQEEESGSGSEPEGTLVVNNIINSYASLAIWKQTNIDNTIADTYGLTVCYGPFDLTTFANDASFGTRAWTSPANAATSNDSRADAGVMPSAQTITQYLKATQMAAGYAPAVGFVPKAVHVTVERRDAGGSGRVVDQQVRLLVGGVKTADNPAAPVVWPASDNVMTYRFTTTATRAQTLAADFGVLVAARSNIGLAGSETTAVNMMGGGGYTFPLVYQSGIGAISSGGGPGADFEIQVFLNNNGASAGFCVGTGRYNTFWTPNGQLLSGSADFYVYNAFNLPGTVFLYLTAEQSGVTYVRVLSTLLVSSVPTVVAGLTFANLADSDFTELSGFTSPNFSSGAANVYFGFGLGHSQGGPFQAYVNFNNMEINAVGSSPSGDSQPQIDHVQIRICGTQ